ncbi:T family of potassium channels protein 7 protein [Fasciola gigantica]|uniref:T family of potassium channels protein 7 protein n=1 Tax=Fasciola gigantica TaxID=46835 RepID=A0A504YHI5_FASGI|nr:T family of potassium channels protein 7 protein [Fasciola gigantica]
MIAAEYGGQSEQILEFSSEETEPRRFTNNNSNKGSDRREINSKHKTSKDDDHNNNSSKAEKNLATFNASKSLSQHFRAFSMRARLVLGRSRLRLLGFFVFYLAFVISGAMVFRVLELPTERAARLRLYALQIGFLRDHPCVSEKDLFDLVQAVIRLHGMGVDATLIRNVSQYSKIDFPTKWKSNFTSTIEGRVGQEIRKIAEAELMKEELNNGNWNLEQAIFFASTIVTTVGYGKVSPYTNAGKIFCILFGSVGIPITLVFSSVLVSICMHPIRKSQERMVMRFCGSEEDSMSYLGPLDNQDKPQYQPQPRPNILELARDVQPCYSEQGLRKKSQMHAVHFDQISKGSSKAKIDLTSDRFSWNSYIKEGESCEVHSVLTIATIPSETLGSMEYLAKNEHKTLSIPPTRNIPCITPLNSIGMMDLAQPSNSYPEIPNAFDDQTVKNEASNISEVRKHNEPTSEFEGNSQSTYKNDKNNNRPVSHQKTALTYNYHDINQSSACCYSEKRSCTGNSEKKSHSSLFKKMKRTTNQPCLGKNGAKKGVGQ